MQSLQLLTSYAWTTQRSIELLVGAQLARWRPGQKASLAPGAKSKFGAPIVEPDDFQKQM